MKAIIYEVEICEGTIAMVHNQYFEIQELYIPSKKIAFNCADGAVHCFETDKFRYNKSNVIKEIDVPAHIAENLNRYIKARKRLDFVADWFQKQM